ncbi:DUF3862 domain-containing protein [Endozoicomonas sp. SM1973]|uniref:DUF3862 domain-containing protein n=1 Tax=Spartinivicinus marinus TaxID=2994442 RepID=A0A853I683_9GAMM|nr:DUF3862 domain-containing protein [Spartinivicinus marinus]MCX4028602.1 hypothetical protein [Spartinivicinus marinus]NYZ67132.1 DUF3862 domain-containing protein [Spartinivicinus marinus]
MRYLSVSILATLLALITGCSKVTSENYNKIKLGMESSEIEQFLGKPTKCDAILTAKQCVWSSGNKSIDVKFVSDKVVLFSNTGL